MSSIACILLCVCSVCFANGKSEEPPKEAAAAAVVEDVKESPMLADLVSKGNLPRLEERLPSKGDEMVEKTVDGNGKFGGVLHLAYRDNAHWDWGPITEQSMFRFKQDGSGEVEPNICKSFSSNADATVWTIVLRKGARWSDGVPFTADDLVFYYDHMSTPALNSDRTPVSSKDPKYHNAFTTKPYKCFQVKKDGKTYWAEFKKVDDYTVTVTFAAPKPTFPVDAAVDNKWMVLPKHFYKNYVSRKDGVTDDPTFPYISEEEALANATRDFKKVWKSYSTMGKSIGYYNWDYAIVPQMRSFIAKGDNWNKAGETYVLERNPYFFKTDSDGRQLPYIDRIEIEIINENEQQVLKASSGALDFYEILQSGDVSTIMQATKETHRIQKYNYCYWANQFCFELNPTIADKDKAALFQNPEFRHALSISVDRNLVCQTLTEGRSKPLQASVPDGLYGYDEEWSKKWTEYDVAKANGILDTLTEKWEGKEGTWRKMKGTDRDLEIVFSIKNITEEGDYFALLQSAFRKIGVKLSEKIDTEIATSILANKVEGCFEYNMGGVNPAIRPDDMIPVRNYRNWYSAYGKWYEDGKSTANGGVEPTGDMLELVNLYEKMQNASGPDRDKIVRDCVDKVYVLHEKNVWLLGFMSATPAYYLVNDNLANLPGKLAISDEFRYSGNIHFEQVYFK